MMFGSHSYSLSSLIISSRRAHWVSSRSLSIQTWSNGLLKSVVGWPYLSFSLCMPIEFWTSRFQFTLFIMNFSSTNFASLVWLMSMKLKNWCAVTESRLLPKSNLGWYSITAATIFWFYWRWTSPSLLSFKISLSYCCFITYKLKF